MLRWYGGDGRDDSGDVEEAGRDLTDIEVIVQPVEVGWTRSSFGNFEEDLKLEKIFLEQTAV